LDMKTTTKAIDLSRYTLSESLDFVSVAAFRLKMSHLEGIVNIDRHACCGTEEVARWIVSAQRVGAELIRTSCKRATHEDWDRRERIIERSSDTINTLKGMR
jgi:hypothetical protein